MCSVIYSLPEREREGEAIHIQGILARQDKYNASPPMAWHVDEMSRLVPSNLSLTAIGSNPLPFIDDYFQIQTIHGDFSWNLPDNNLGRVGQIFCVLSHIWMYGTNIYIYTCKQPNTVMHRNTKFSAQFPSEGSFRLPLNKNKNKETLAHYAIMAVRQMIRGPTSQFFSAPCHSQPSRWCSHLTSRAKTSLCTALSG